MLEYNNTILRGLNDKQKASILSEAKRVLVLAGAGSGKTKTVISKLLYLIFEKNVKPSSILAITFTKNAANEMIDRLIVSSETTNTYEAFIQNKTTTALQKDVERRKRIQEQPWISNLTIRTFHSLCYKILRDNGNPVFDNKFKLITDNDVEEVGVELKGMDILSSEKPKDIIGKMLILACKNRGYFLKLKRYILDYYVDKVSLDKEMKSYANEGQRTYTTLKGETVKSKSERDIADWLYRHNIKYVYEKVTNFKDFNFKPDFFIPQANLYLEHVTDKSYSMENKEKQFIKSGKNCVITYESIMNNSMLFNLAMERIIKGKITEEITEEISLNYEEEFKSYHNKVDEFLKTVMRLQSMIKGEDINPISLFDKSSISEHERIRVFYELAIPLIESYKSYCTNKSYVDFDDLIILTVKLLIENPDVRSFYQNKYNYLMVDEFQDVNGLQVKLLDLLLKPENQLFCVGDDWQSIYGFRGSDVDYIVNFEKHYKNCEVYKLDMNYRSTQTIVGASNEVIKHNKNQISKDIKAFKQTPSKIQIYRAKSLDIDGVDFLVEEVRKLYSSGLGKDDILVLYRRSKMYSHYFSALKDNKLFVSSKTIHASKGLEAKAVFIIGLKEGNGGFPDIWLDDAIFRVVKDVKYDILLEEERRLFYVAITRAKDQLFLITELGNESSFVDEIPNHFFQINKSGLKSDVELMLACDKCGLSINESDNFCSKCGNKLTSELTPKELPDYVKKARLIHKNAYETWSSDDDLKLKELYLQGNSIKQLSAYFGRNSGAITARIQKLGFE
ncbi:UvrD-helicase domain-containing protein [Flavobacterium orientale]|uniref:DNA 3'-5' helicase n=1 Tax=Flavobacterium orientale TaxID=1756020 RepID=A0A916Y2H4_9FLAO|nr:UvrD-helicase domain-containing protein [Flavobacterium orientale]GGD26414.1 DNA helicase [Flavobacterium orientale]